MIHIVAPTDVRRRLPFYLAMEEWAAATLPAAEYFFTWIVEPTVICGRNQDIDAEVDIAYCREHGVDIVRRKSGGGCVYADNDNIMVSLVSPRTDVEGAFARFSALLASLLRKLGLDAEASGRNDVLISGRKVAGGAFYKLPDRSIIHSTLLFSTDMDHMLRAITPSRAKLESKMVQSVQSRITTVSEHLPELSIGDLRQALIGHMSAGDAELVLTAADIAAIEKIEQAYYDPRWLHGRRHDGRLSVLLPSVGTVSVHTSLAPDGTLADISLTGDFFALSDLEEGIYSKVRGSRPDAGSLSHALAGVDASAIIRGLSTEQLVSLIATNQS